LTGRAHVRFGSVSGVSRDAPIAEELGMPVWTVRLAEGSEERVEAGLLATENGTLVAMSEEGLLLRAWASGQWRTVEHCGDSAPPPRGRLRGSVLVGVPGR
jgi:hypothetical protein